MLRPLVTTLSLMALTALTLHPAPVQAQDVAAAETLFNQGLHDMTAGKYATGCPALRESQRLDPRPGTLFTLAECEWKAGLYATASARYEDYLQTFARLTPEQQKKQLGREKIASERKAEIAPDVPTLLVRLPPSAPKGTRVFRGDVELSGPSLGVALPIDPGEHIFTVHHPDGRTLEQHITIEKGQTLDKTIDVPPPRAPDPPKGVVVKPPPVTEGAATSSGARIGAYVAGGVGLLGIGVGAVTGALALGKKSVIEANCNDVECNQEGLYAANTGQTFGLVSTIGFAVGLAGVATSVTLLVLSSKSKDPSKSAIRFGADPIDGGAFAQMGGRW